jgi:hypothetical protein
MASNSYPWLGSGLVTESGSSGWKVRGILGLVAGILWWWYILLGNEVIDGLLLHGLVQVPFQ